MTCYSIVIKVGVLLLCIVALLFLMWPAYRSHLNIVIDDGNEGWNAYYADAAWGSMPLYPSADKLITNNYPPLSFYVVGAFGKLLGDNIFAGRVLSVASVLIIGLAIGRIVIILDGGLLSAGVGAAYFIATMSRFFSSYVGMNDPQLFAQAIMSIAFLLFVSSTKHHSGFVGPILLMVFAGFFKHNILGIPLTAMAWLAIYERNEFFKCAAISLGAIFMGFAACQIAYGHNFFLNFLSPREFSLQEGLNSYPDFKWFISGLLIWIIAGFMFRNDPRIKICNLFVIISLVTALVEKCGSGVDVNAYFDFVIALALTTGITFQIIPTLSLKNWFPSDCVRIGVIILVFACLAQTPETLDPISELLRGTLKNKITQSIVATAKAIETFKNCPTNVKGDQMILYRSGKPFFVDECNVGERIHAKKLPKNVLKKLIDEGKLTECYVDPRIYSLTP